LQAEAPCLSAISIRQPWGKRWNNGMPYDPLPELLALKAIVQFLLDEKVREYQDVNAAIFEISKACFELISETSVGAPDPERIKQSALRQIDDIFMSLKPVQK
jgi:hypothetical protein